MRIRLLFGVVFGLLAGVVLWAQATHIHTSGTLPTNCTVGDIYYKTGASAGFYTCTATDTWTVVGGGGSGALSAITAATASNTIASGDNSGQVWNWQLTTTDTTAFTFGETAASTAGGVSNLVAINTVASSTLIPLYIKCYGVGASCFRIDDVSGDTSPFVVDASGKVAIGTASPSNSFTVSSATGSDFTNSSATITIGGSGARGDIASNTDLRLGAANTFINIVASGTTQIRRTSPPTGLGSADSYLRLGLDEDALNGYYNIMFGFNGKRAYMGFQETDNTGQTKGDLVFGVRADTTSSDPTEALRIVSDHTVNVDSLKTTGSATGKNVVCVDTATGKLYASSTGTDCSN